MIRRTLFRLCPLLATNFRIAPSVWCLLLHEATVVVWFVAMIAWGVAGFMLLRMLRSVSEIPRVHALKRLLGAFFLALPFGTLATSQLLEQRTC